MELNEEEKKAIKDCDTIFMCLEDMMSKESADDYKSSYRLIKNLINNQQKEIERLNGTINSIYYHYLECRGLEKEINENWEDKIRKIILNKRKKVLEKKYSNLSIVKRIYKRNIQVAMLDTLLKELLEEN